MFNAATTSLFLIVFSIILSSCAGIQPIVDYDPKFQFDRIESYAFLPRGALESKSPFLSDMNRNRIEMAIEKQMGSRGLEYRKSLQAADVAVSYMVATKDRKDIRTYNSAGHYRCWRCAPNAHPEIQVINYKEGTLIIDIIDQKNKRSVWRGVLHDKIQPKSNPDARREYIDAVIASVMQTFPPQTQKLNNPE